MAQPVGRSPTGCSLAPDNRRIHAALYPNRRSSRCDPPRLARYPHRTDHRLRHRNALDHPPRHQSFPRTSFHATQSRRNMGRRLSLHPTHRTKRPANMALLDTRRQPKSSGSSPPRSPTPRPRHTSQTTPKTPPHRHLHTTRSQRAP